MKLAELKQHLDIVEVIGRYIHVAKQGHEWVALCPFHDDKKPSMTVVPKKQMFWCPVCSASGDAIDFVAKFKGIEIAEAAKLLTPSGVEHDRAKPIMRPVEQTAEVVQVVPATYTPGNIVHPKYGAPSAKWEYLNTDGKLVGYALRFDHADGSKDVLPYYQFLINGQNVWKFKAANSPRMLYRADLLGKYPNSTVLVVEGEKTCNAVNTQLDPEKTICISWPGGGKAVKYANWSLLTGRKLVVFWPDNDMEGLSAMLQIKHILQPPRSYILPINNKLPKGWDAADRQWEAGELSAYVKKNMVPGIPTNHQDDLIPDGWMFKQVVKNEYCTFGPTATGAWKYIVTKVEDVPFQPDLLPLDAVVPPPPVDAPPHGPIDEPTEEYEDYFRFMGFIKTQESQQFVFFIKESQLLYTAKASGIGSVSALLQLAPLHFWSDRFPKSAGKGSTVGINTDIALDWMIRMSNRVGIFKPSYIRGRGAWKEGPDVVFHTGEYIIKERRRYPLQSYKSRYLYEAGEYVAVDASKPLANVEAAQLLELLKMANWELPNISPYLLAGWIVLAPFCGALPWRPHIWLTGGAGTGKSWILANIVRRCLGDAALAVNDVTAAYLRQTLRSDALPVLVDEAESENKNAADRIQDLLGLIRNSSTEDSGVGGRGSGFGATSTYTPRSMFAMASIAPGLEQKSDISRVSILSMREIADKKERDAQWKKMKQRWLEVINDRFTSGLLSRSMWLLPTILENVEVFREAAANVLGKQRAGDQVGTLLAGAYALTSIHKITLDKAEAWLRKQEMDKAQAPSERDEVHLWQIICTHIVRVEDVPGDNHASTVERTVGELIGIVIENYTFGDSAVPLSTAKAKLKRIGIIASEIDPLIWISIKHPAVRAMLDKYPQYQRGYEEILKRLDGAMYSPRKSFAGAETPAVGVPVGLLKL